MSFLSEDSPIMIPFVFFLVMLYFSLFDIIIIGSIGKSYRTDNCFFDNSGVSCQYFFVQYLPITMVVSLQDLSIFVDDVVAS